MYLTTVAHLNIIIQEKESFMYLWQLYIVVGLACIIFEMLVPSMFFLNLAIAGLLSAVAALFIENWIYLLLIFVVLSVASIAFLRPILIQNIKNKEQETGMEGKYIGKIVKVKEAVSKFSGAITIYDERWEARCDSDDTIEEGAEVRIISYDSLVLKVERI